MKVAVTGGTGVVGHVVVRHLVDDGHEVVALARSDEGARLLAGLGAISVEGDVLDTSSLPALVQGSDWVFHVAGVNEMCSAHPGRMDQVNVEGTRNVLDTCQDQGVGRLVFTSSAVTIGEESGVVGREDTVHRGSYLSRYGRSKHLAEKLVLSRAEDLEVVVVNPSSVQGPGRATGTGKLFLDLLSGRLPFLLDAIFSIVDIDDCARGHLLAAKSGQPGERYILSGAMTDMRAAVTLLEDITGDYLSARFLPARLATWGAPVVEAVARLTGREAPICREMVRVLAAGARYDGSKATRELGLDYTQVRETISRTVRWFEDEGLLADDASRIHR